MSTAQTNIPKKPEKLNEASTSSDTASRLCECSGNTDTGGREKEKLPGEGCPTGWAVGRTLGMGTGKGTGNGIGKGMDTGNGIGRGSGLGAGMGTGIGTGTGMGTDADSSCGKESADNRAS